MFKGIVNNYFDTFFNKRFTRLKKFLHWLNICSLGNWQFTQHFNKHLCLSEKIVIF
jgi:hypothetical protein